LQAFEASASKAASVKLLEMLNALHEKLLHYQHPTIEEVQLLPEYLISG